MVKMQEQISASVPTMVPSQSSPGRASCFSQNRGSSGCRFSGEKVGEAGCLWHLIPAASSLVAHKLHFTKALCRPMSATGLV